MPVLLIVHHTPSPATHEMLEAVRSGAEDDAIPDVSVVTRPALTASPVDVLRADGCILGTSANIGYMSGAMKHFLDQVYYPCLVETQRRPYAVYVHGNEDTGGAVRALGAIAGALQWRQVHEAVEVRGKPTQEALDALWNLGATVAATLSDEAV